MKCALKSLLTVHFLQDFVADNQNIQLKIFHRLTFFDFDFCFIFDTNS